MILAGIDEAGYGPLLGPLVVGCCAFQLDGDPQAQLPCLWTRLCKLTSRRRVHGGKKLHINDSKLVYSPSSGLKELERSVLTVATAWQGPAEDLLGFIRLVASHAGDDWAEYPWYRPFVGESFPLEQDATSLRLFANALRMEMERARTQCVYMGARLVFERQLNQLLDSTRNKGNALFSIAAIHLDHLIRTYGQQGLVIFCDRQGGRGHYGSLLRLMFEDWALEITRESEGYSEYHLRRSPHAVRVIFTENAESQCLPVALASMLSKYLREAFMRRFNAFWRMQVPAVAPTAGYYTDGVRFLHDIDAKRKELGIADGQLIRSR